jgi:hypothetical protein
MVMCEFVTHSGERGNIQITDIEVVTGKEWNMKHNVIFNHTRAMGKIEQQNE